MTVIATNLTIAAITLDDLGVTVPALGAVELTVQLRTDELIGSALLAGHVALGEISLSDGIAEIAATNWLALTSGNVASALFVTSERFEAFDAPIDITTSTAFKTKIALTKPLSGGTYWVSHGYGWNHDSQTNDFVGQLLVNGTRLGELHRQEPKDSQGGDPTGTSQRLYVARKHRVLLSAGQTTFELQYRTDTSGVESSIWEAYVIIEKAIP